MGFFSGLTGSFGGALGGASSALGFVDSLAGMFGQSSSQRYNRKMMQAEHNFQAAQAELQRQWQSKEAQISRDYNTEMWNKTNEYNSPLALFGRLSEAGVNPYSAFANDSYGTTASQLPASVSAGSGSSAVGTTPPYQRDLSSSFNDIASSLSLVSQAKKAGVETRSIEETLGLTIDNLSVDLAIKKLQQGILSLDLKLKPQEQDLLISKLRAEIDKITSDTDLNSYEIQKTMYEVDEILSRTDLNKEQKKLLENEVKTYFLRLGKDFERIDSEVSANYSSANLHKQQASLYKVQTEVQEAVKNDAIKIEKYKASYAKLEYELRKVNSAAERRAVWFRFFNEIRQGDIISKRLYEELKRLRVQNKFEEINQVFNSINNGVSLGRNVIGLFGDASSSGLFTPPQIPPSGGVQLPSYPQYY